MKNSEEIWRQRLWIWLPPLVFFLLNLAAFSVYRLGYAGSVQSLGQTLKEDHGELRRLEAQRLDLERLIDRARANRQRVAALYEDRFSTRRHRLTEITAEVRGMAMKAGLDPREVSYPEEQIEDYGLVKRSFIFSVDGNYAELRKFIDLLERSESFLTLEDVTLGEGNKGPELRMNLRLSTLFAKEGAPETPRAAAPAPRRKAGAG
ncbi:MAG TPA: hypothetical protein VOA87_12520 [Thermoanaerobaculia bacterium]|nr:hypothetical protein [Thermoanaerobaculia bacterium]